MPKKSITALIQGFCKTIGYKFKPFIREGFEGLGGLFQKSPKRILS